MHGGSVAMNGHYRQREPLNRGASLRELLCLLGMRLVVTAVRVGGFVRRVLSHDLVAMDLSATVQPRVCDEKRSAESSPKASRHGNPRQLQADTVQK